jgi:hypothetical protein
MDTCEGGIGEEVVVACFEGISCNPEAVSDALVFTLF